MTRQLGKRVGQLESRMLALKRQRCHVVLEWVNPKTGEVLFDSDGYLPARPEEGIERGGGAAGPVSGEELAARSRRGAE